VRRPFIAGNWKMNLDRSGAVALAREVAIQARRFDYIELAVFPPSVYVEAVAEVLRDTSVGWGVQNVYHRPNGAFTGEISVAMLQDLGCRYAILGHSERRQHFGETDEEVNRKLLAILAGGLVPIVCVGERLDEREAGQTLDVIRRQISGSLAGLSADQMSRVVIAYEPVWAIGTGRACDALEANRVCGIVRSTIGGIFGEKAAATVRIQYGGSVTEENAHELISQPEIDGGLVGGASLSPAKFAQIVQAASVIAQQTRYT